MDFIHFLNKSKLDLVIKNGIKRDNCYRGNGILIYPNSNIPFKSFSKDVELIEDEKLANKLSNDKKWEKIGALGFRQERETVYGIKLKLTNSYYPLKVFIDIQSEIAREFGKLLDHVKFSGIKFSDGNTTLTKFINKISSSRFTFEAMFIVNSENDLKKLIELFKRAGGGIWGAHSFDCMIELDIPTDFFKEIIEF